MMLHYQSMHKNFENRKKHISNLIWFFSNFHFLVESHYLDPSLFKQTVFCKRKLPLFFLSFSTLYLFLQHLISDMSVFFFANFQSPKKYIFWRKRIRHSFFRFFFHFLFKVKHHPISRKKQNEKLYFFIFQKFKTHFFVLTRVNFFEF